MHGVGRLEAHRQAARGQGRSEGVWRVGVVEGARGGREGGSNDVRQGGSGSGGRVNKGTSEEGMERGMVGVRGRKEGGSERRKEGAGREGATERGEEQGKCEGRREQGRHGNFKGGTLRKTD